MHWTVLMVDENAIKIWKPHQTKMTMIVMTAIHMSPHHMKRHWLTKTIMHIKPQKKKALNANNIPWETSINSKRH